jgi:N-formylglutamate amidohydrolase
VLVDLAEAVFTGAGLKVARNRPYAGGFSTRTYGRPQHGVHALQIELSRHLYMNEVTLEKNEGFGAIRQLVDRLVVTLTGLDFGVLSPPAPVQEKYAAE